MLVSPLRVALQQLRVDTRAHFACGISGRDAVLTFDLFPDVIVYTDVDEIAAELLRHTEGAVFFCAGADASTELVASAFALCSCFEARGVRCIIHAIVSRCPSDILEQFSDAGQLATFGSCSLPPLGWKARWLVRGVTVTTSSSSQWAQASAASFELPEGGEGLCSCLLLGWTPAVTITQDGVSVFSQSAGLPFQGGGEGRALLAVKLDTLWGFDSAVTAPLLAEFDKPDLEAVEACRATFLRRESQPLRMVSLLLQTFAADFCVAEPPLEDTPSPGDLSALVCPLREACPYLQDRSARGLSMVQCACGVDGAQQSRQTRPRGARSLLPQGMPPTVHAQCAVAAPSRTQEEPTLPDDLDLSRQVWWSASHFLVFHVGASSGFAL